MHCAISDFLSNSARSTCPEYQPVGCYRTLNCTSVTISHRLLIYLFSLSWQQVLYSKRVYIALVLHLFLCLLEKTLIYLIWLQLLQAPWFLNSSEFIFAGAVIALFTKICTSCKPLLQSSSCLPPFFPIYSTNCQSTKHRDLKCDKQCDKYKDRE